MRVNILQLKQQIKEDINRIKIAILEKKDSEMAFRVPW